MSFNLTNPTSQTNQTEHLAFIEEKKEGATFRV